MNTSAEHKLSVDRSTTQKFWQSAIIMFLQKCNDQTLKVLIALFNLIAQEIQFLVKADSCALRSEFYEDTIYIANLKERMTNVY